MPKYNLIKIIYYNFTCIVQQATTFLEEICLDLSESKITFYSGVFVNLLNLGSNLKKSNQKQNSNKKDTLKDILTIEDNVAELNSINFTAFNMTQVSLPGNSANLLHDIKEMNGEKNKDQKKSFIEEEKGLVNNEINNKQDQIKDQNKDSKRQVVLEKEFFEIKSSLENLQHDFQSIFYFE